MNKVLVGGCFDLIHFGHVRFLKAAKKAGDYLVVMLESDENVKRLKGPNRPIHTQQERAAMLKSLRMVNKVVMLPPLTTYNDYFVWVKKIKPDVIAVTSNDPKIELKKKQAVAIGATIKEVTELLKNYSTSTLIRELDL